MQSKVVYLANLQPVARRVVLEGARNSLLSRLRMAAYQAAETTIEYGGGDATELVALVEQVAALENCTAECTQVLDCRSLLQIQFKRTAGVPQP